MRLAGVDLVLSAPLGVWALYARVAERYRKRHEGCDERSARLTAIRMMALLMTAGIRLSGLNR